MQQTDSLPAPLTQLSQDEALFRDSVYEFADREIRPLVREMDEHAKIPPSLQTKHIDLGVMGNEIPEAHGGAAAKERCAFRDPFKGLFRLTAQPL